MIKLYDYELSGNCYKVRLMLSLLGLEYEKVEVEFFPSKAHKSDEFLAINPLGQLPALEDGELVLRDAQAILSYLAARYDQQGSWYPLQDPARLAEVNMWLAFANDMSNASSAARLAEVFGYELDADAARANAYERFAVLDQQLWFSEHEQHGWVCSGTQPTIADIACFPYVMLADEGGMSLMDYPAIRRWTDRVKSLPGFVVMSGIFHTAAA